MIEGHREFVHQSRATVTPVKEVVGFQTESCSDRGVAGSPSGVTALRHASEPWWIVGSQACDRFC